ncbi:MAG: transcription elongation factor GreAB [Rhizobacter sp.]|nr:transcription elongation factor GreAB [Rhizobacter sp.]
MNATPHGERTLTELDHLRLTKLVDPKSHPALEALLDLTDVVSSREVAADVVTMNSQVEVVDEQSGQRQKLTVCYPPDAQPSAGLVSVLSPIGTGLLGTRLGTVATWQTPHGDECAARVEAILFQPEASGDYTR